jgi:hypothetical protein
MKNISMKLLNLNILNIWLWSDVPNKILKELNFITEEEMQRYGM